MNFGECRHNNIGGCSECEEELEDENSELKIEVKQLKAVVSAVGAALPPGARYLDPPDGGDVSFGEQVRRIVAHVQEPDMTIYCAYCGNDNIHSLECIKLRPNPPTTCPNPKCGQSLMRQLGSTKWWRCEHCGFTGHDPRIN